MARTGGGAADGRQGEARRAPEAELEAVGQAVRARQLEQLRRRGVEAGLAIERRAYL
jgi:hypothetical protein